MSGALRFFGVTSVIGGALYALWALVAGDGSLAGQLLAVGVLIAGVFWGVVLAAAANAYAWLERLAKQFGVHETQDPD